MAARGVEFAHVSFELPGGRRLLDDVSLAVEPGTTTALLGRSGSGKTTLLRTVNRLVEPTSGAVRVGGVDVGTVDPLELRRGVGYVIQETGLFPHLTVERNVGMALELAGKPKAEQRARAAEVLRLVGLPVDVGKRHPWQLSGGQRQRAGLARALANEPQVLLMDEPFGALDPMTRAEMQDLLKETLARLNTTVLIVTHDLQEALYLAGQVCFLEGGKLRACLAAQAVMRSEDETVQKYVAATTRGAEKRSAHA